MIKLNFRLLIALSLVFWLWKNGKINLIESFQNVSLFALFASSFLLIVNMVLISIRWKIVISSLLETNVSFKSIHTLNWVSQFFSVFLPGSFGGDVVKVLYSKKLSENISPKKILLTVLMDRIFGLIGIINIGAIFSGYKLLFYFNEISRIQFYLFLLNFAICGILIFSIFLIQSEIVWKNISRLFSRLLKDINKPYFKINDYFKVFSISILSQFCCLTSFYIIAKSSIQLSSGISPSFVDWLCHLPIAFIVKTLPISIGGIGTGHLAYDYVFSLISISNGADLFNLNLFLTIMLSLFGIIPYLLLKRDKI